MWTKDDVAEQKRTISEQNLKGEEAIGATIEIFWQDDDAEAGGMWYAGNIDEFNGTLHHVTYEDGDSDWYDLNSIKHHVLEMPLNKSKNMATSFGNDTARGAKCGFYYNPDDQRTCVCVKDEYQCGKTVCAANLAKPAGQIICFFYLGGLIALAVVGLLFRFGQKNPEGWSPSPN